MYRHYIPSSLLVLDYIKKLNASKLQSSTFKIFETKPISLTSLILYHYAAFLNPLPT